jgi:hypothetical protein
MQSLSEEERIDCLEKKVDEGFRDVKAEMRAEILAARGDARSDFRTLLAVLLAMYMTVILGFAALLLQH